MHQLSIDPACCPQELARGLAEVCQDFPRRFTADAADAYTLRFVSDPDLAAGAVVKVEERTITVAYGRRVDAFRALGGIMGMSAPHGFSETARFDTLGVMVDASRNGVLAVDAGKHLLRRLALMGLNMMMLYTEDTYEVSGEPFFGYLRGRYTCDELKDLDDYADLFGIEMIPCIQALSHLEQILQWDAYADYRDTATVMLADSDKTYALLERMINAAQAPFRTQRIHLGMDEAHGIGTGRYRQIHGEKRPFDILNEHLARVRDICTRLGLRPMIWSDMYFRLGSKTNSYYDPDAAVPEDVRAQIPEDVELIYWDYYHRDPEAYGRMITRHRELGKEPIFAGGLWTWNHFWAPLTFAMNTVEASMTACKSHGVREAFTTLWGDDGMECDVFSALPALQLFADHGYADSVDQSRLRENFRGTCDADFDDWVAADGIDSLPCLRAPEDSFTNASKWLLWQDPFLSIMDPCVEDAPLRKHYEQLADALFRAADKGPRARRLLFPAWIAKTLAYKSELRRRLAGAYKSGDKMQLGELIAGDLANLETALDELWQCHRSVWQACYKPFGWEVVERRYGGLMLRLRTVRKRIQDYIDGLVPALPELEVELENAFPGVKPGDLPHAGHARAATPSYIK